MTRILQLIAALAATLVLGAVAVQPAFAATRYSTPTPSPSSSPSGGSVAQQLQSLEQQLQQQQATVNGLANQVESEQASVNTLNSKVAQDKQQEKKLDTRMDAVARIEYERPALSLTTVLQAQNLGQLLNGVAQARLVARRQQDLFQQAKALRAKDQSSQTAAKAQLAKISQQKSQASSIAAQTQSEVTTLQVEQAQQGQAQAQSASHATSQTATSGSTAKAAPTESSTPAFTASTQITLAPGPTNPNTFYSGQCTWYVAQIYDITWHGNANEWPAAAAAAGQAEGSTPVVGAIMESADSGYGHVSVVTAVQDANDWTVTEMNYMGEGVTDTRQVSRASSNLVTFIY